MGAASFPLFCPLDQLDVRHHIDRPMSADVMDVVQRAAGCRIGIQRIECLLLEGAIQYANPALRQQLLCHVHVDASRHADYEYFHFQHELRVMKCSCPPWFIDRSTDCVFLTQVARGTAAVSGDAGAGDEYSGTQSFSAARTWRSSDGGSPFSHASRPSSHADSTLRARAMRNFGCGVVNVCSSSVRTSS